METKNGDTVMTARYINPYTDFGFKKLFGEEASKDLLIDFLNELLPIEHKIVHLSFSNPEQLGAVAAERKAIFDIHCEDETGSKFIVEMQKARIKFFKDRAVFYTTFPIREQAEKGDWNFHLNPIYCVAILDFTYGEERRQKDFISNVQLKDQYCQVFYDKLVYIFVEMPRFTKTEGELASHKDKWMYFLKYLENFEDIPDILKEDVFIMGFQIAEIAKFSSEQLAQYEESLKVYRDLKGVVDTSFEEGKLEGLKEGMEKGIRLGEDQGMQKGEKKRAEKMARTMKAAGESIEKIIRYTDLSRKEIEQL
jgi:predicted transposase/invertase (TIGR01784 family)